MKIILLSIVVAFPLFFFSQEYKSAIGIKTGFPGILGVNYKSYLHTKSIALDNNIGINFDIDNKYIMFQSLLEYNRPIGENMGYNIYAGVGPTLNYYTKGGYITDDLVSHPGLLVRADAVFGIEVTPKSIPLNAAFEVGPNFMFIPVTQLGLSLNVALRYAIK